MKKLTKDDVDKMVLFYLEKKESPGGPLQGGGMDGARQKQLNKVLMGRMKPTEVTGAKRFDQD